MGRAKLRKLKHKGRSYLWKRAHYHLEKYKVCECVELVTIYLEGYKNSPLKVHFREEDNKNTDSNPESRKWLVGYPDSGVIWTGSNHDEKANYVEVNLNHPKIIVKIIDYFLMNNWKPKIDSQAFVVEGALTLFEDIFSEEITYKQSLKHFRFQNNK